MEIERKFLIKTPPSNYSQFPVLFIEQAYLCTDPVIRIRRQNEDYLLTYKSKGLLSREEHNLPLTRESYEHLKAKVDGLVLTKKRYHLPLPTNLTIELDVFEGDYKGLILAEVEFDSEKEALDFIPPQWFDRDVTFSGEFQNSRLSKEKIHVI